MKAKLIVGALAVMGMSASALADGIFLPMDPGTNFMLYSSNSNDGYGSYRGMVFTADEDIVVDGASLYTQSSSGLNATFELWDTNGATNGNVLAGAALIASVNTQLIGTLDFYGDKFAPVSLEAGESYLLRVTYQEAADENWFFDFDPGFFGDPPVDIGPITLIDGTLGGDTSNFVAPYLGLQYGDIPAPGALALFGLAGLATRRRRG